MSVAMLVSVVAYRLLGLARVDALGPGTVPA